MYRANRTVVTVLIATVGGALLSGCSQPKNEPVQAAAAATPTPVPSGLEGTSWVLAELPGRSDGADQRATAQFTSGRVQGSDGCNRYSAPFTATASALSVGARGISSQMACPPDVTARAEAFMAALTGASGYRIAGGRLELLSSGGAVLAVMAPQPTTLVGKWHVTGINNGRHAVVGVISEGQLEMVFSADGKVTGSAGCNRFNAGYEVNGSSVRFTPAGTTRMSCPGEGVMEQERAFIAAMAMVTTMRMDGDQVEMRRPDGELALLLRRVPG